MHDVVIVDGCRTPFQKALTGFSDLMSYQLAAATVRGLVERSGAEAVDRVVFGATVHNPRTTNVAREALLHAGLPATVPGVTVTAAGASATVAIEQGIDRIRGGEAEVVIAGGTDCISDPPIGYSRAMREKLLRGRRLRGLGETVRHLLRFRPWDFLPDAPDVVEFSTGESMGEHTEGLAERLDIPRAEQDAYAVRSHQRAHAARDRHAEEMVAVPEAPSVTADNGVRPETSVEALSRLRPAFARNGTLTPGNSTFLTDGAAAVLLASEARARREGWPIRARIRDAVLTAHDPADELLLGPAYAIPRLLERAGLGLDEVDVFEIHEAFAAQILAVRRLLASESFCRERLGRDAPCGELDHERLNAWGGSLSIGNPFAPNGARLVVTAAHRLAVEEGAFAVVATCAGGGLGSALLLERGPATDSSGRSSGRTSGRSSERSRPRAIGEDDGAANRR